MKTRFVIFLVAVMFVVKMHAVCVYNHEAHAIWIYDYTQDLPAGPRQLLFADQINGWNLVTYDRSNHAYTVNANLWIGRDDARDTYFQVGASGRAAETLILKGDLVISPARAGRINRLAIGSLDTPSGGSRLLFHNTAGQRYTLRAGAYHKGDTMAAGVLNSGELHVYHGRIAAVDPRYPMGKHLFLYLDRLVLQNAVIAQVAGTIGYGINVKNSRIADCVFEDSGNAFGWGAQAMRGVTFRRLGTAFSDSTRYPLAATLTECRFEDNDCNWELVAGNMYLVDCEIGRPRKGNRYASRTNTFFTVHHARVGADRAAVSAMDMPESLRAISSRHVIFKVIDNQGRPVKNARVEARSEQDDRICRAAVTGADGCTPGRGAAGALLLDEWEESAGALENAPVRRDFSYTITMTPQRGHPARVCEEFCPTQSWRMVEVTPR